MTAPNIVSTSTDNWAGSFPLAYTQTHDATGASALLVYFFSASSYPTLTPTATYAGVAMTLVGTVAGTSNRTVWVWVLDAPATGSNTLAISLAGQFIDNGVCVVVGLSGTPGAGAVGASSLVAAVSTQSACSLILAGGDSLVLGFGTGYFNTPNTATGSPTPVLNTSNLTNANYPTYLYTQPGGALAAADSFTMDASFNATIAAAVEILGVAGPPAQTIVATAVDATFALDAVTVVLGPAPQVITAASVTGVFALGAAVIVIPYFVTAASVTASFVLGTAQVTYPQEITAAPLAGSFALGTLTLFQGLSITAAPLGATFALGSASVISAHSITVAPLALVFSLGSETVVESNFLVFPLTLAPGATATFHLKFTPAVAGPRTGTLSFASNAPPGTVALTGIGTGAPLLRLSTLGSQIVDSAGATVRLKSINWFGAESPNYIPHGIWARRWSDMLDQIAGLGFNCIRLPFSDDILNGANIPNGIDTSLNADLAALSALEILDMIIDYGGSIGLRFVLDHHRISSAGGAGTDGWPNTDFTDSYTPAMWLTMWQAMATRYHANPAVCGFDPHNEPHNPTWAVWASHVVTLANAVHAIAPDWLCFVEGVGAGTAGSYWWGGYLAEAAAQPVVLTVPNKVVYSPHEYGLSVGAQAWLQSSTHTVAGWTGSLAAIWDVFWGGLFVDGTAPVWIGEFGGKLGFTGTGAVDGTQVNASYEVQWLNTLMQYINGDTDLDGVTDLTGTQKGISFSYWSWNPNSGDTGGLLEDDWTTVQPGKLALLNTLLAA